MEPGDKNSSHTVLNDCQSAIKPIQGQMSLRVRSFRQRGGKGIVPSGLYCDSSDDGHYPQKLQCFGSFKAGHIFHFPSFFPLIKRLFVGTEESPWRWHPPA